MLYGSIRQNGLHLNADFFELPAQNSANIEIQYEIDNEYSSYGFSINVGYWNGIKYVSGGVPISAGIMRLPAEVFAYSGQIFISYAFAKNNELIITHPVTLTVVGAPGVSVELPETEVWQSLVTQLVSSYLEINGIPTGGEEGQVITKCSNGNQWKAIPNEIPLDGVAGYVLTKTDTGFEWKAIPNEIPLDGEAKDVLVKTATGLKWSNSLPKLIRDVTLQSEKCSANTDEYKDIYKYCVNYPIDDMTDTCTANIVFHPTTLATGCIADQGRTLDGVLRIYLNFIPTTNIDILSIIYQEVGL